MARVSNKTIFSVLLVIFLALFAQTTLYAFKTSGPLIVNAGSDQSIAFPNIIGAEDDFLAVSDDPSKLEWSASKKFSAIVFRDLNVNVNSNLGGTTFMEKYGTLDEVVCSTLAITSCVVQTDVTLQICLQAVAINSANHGSLIVNLTTKQQLVSGSADYHSSPLLGCAFLDAKANDVLGLSLGMNNENSGNRTMFIIRNL